MALTESEELELLELEAAQASSKVPFKQKLRDFGVGALKGGALETAGTMAGGLGGGVLGAGAGGIGAIPGSVGGATLGAAAGKNIEDIILKYMGEGQTKSFADQSMSDIGAGARGATSEMAGQSASALLAKLGKVLFSPAGNYLKERVAPRLMTSAVKDADLAKDMLKRGEYGTARSLLSKGEKGVSDLSGQVDDILSGIDEPIDRMKIVDRLEGLRKEYAKLPGRDSEGSAIEEIQKLIFQSPADEQVEKGVTDYARLKPFGANDLKRSIYSENKKLYQGGNYDPASIRAQMDMAIAKGLKEGIEEAAPQVAGLNQELGHNIQLRDTMESILEKSDKANLIQLRPLLTGLGLISQGALPAAAGPVGINLMGTTLGGTGAATIANKLGQRMMERSGTPVTSWLTRMLTSQNLRD